MKTPKESIGQLYARWSALYHKAGDFTESHYNETSRLERKIEKQRSTTLREVAQKEALADEMSDDQAYRLLKSVIADLLSLGAKKLAKAV